MSVILPNKLLHGIPGIIEKENSVARWKNINEITDSPDIFINDEGKMSIGQNIDNESMLSVACNDFDIVGLKIKAHASQTEDLLKIVSDDETSLFIINYKGDVGVTISSPNEPLHVQSDFDGNRGIRIGNESDGESAVARFIVDVLGGSTFLAGYGSNFETSGSRKANSGSLIANAQMSNGFSIVSRHPSGGDIRLYTGGNLDSNLRITITATGDCNIGDGGLTNYAKISESGIKLYGTTQKWICLDLTPINIGLPSSNPPLRDEYQGFPFDRYDRSTEEQVYFICHLKNDYAVGTSSIRGHFGMIVENPPSGTGNEIVIMGYEFKKITPNSDIFDFSSGTTTGIIEIIIEDGESPRKWHASDIGYVDTTGFDKEDILLFRFFRDATNPNDTYDNEAVASNNDAWIGMYHMEYLIDGLGGN